MQPILLTVPPPRPLCRRESAERPLRDTSGRECRRRCAWNDRGFGWWAWWGGGVVGCCVKYAVVWAGCTTLTLSFLIRTPRRSALERPPSDIGGRLYWQRCLGIDRMLGWCASWGGGAPGCCFDLCRACGPTSPHHAALSKVHLAVVRAVRAVGGAGGPWLVVALSL